MNTDTTRRPTYEPCDSVEAIARRLTSVAAFVDLVRQREHLGRERLPLEAFVVARRWVLDAHGQLGLLEDTEPLPPSLQRVVALRAIERIVDISGLSWRAVSPERLSRAMGRCFACERGWTIEDCHDVAEHNADSGGGAGHYDCVFALRADREADWFKSLFQEAGYPLIGLRPFPNAYWPATYANSFPRFVAPPWFVARTVLGAVTIGWRKRVISIEWDADASGVDGRSLFASEDVTKEAGLVHAWGREKAIEYLRRMRETAIAKRDGVIT